MEPKALPPISIYPDTVDSHFHPAVMESRGADIETLLPSLHRAGLARALEISITLDDERERLARLKRYPFLLATMGYHPSQAGRVDLATVEQKLPLALGTSGVVAVGEIGLDWFREYGSSEQQIELFLLQLEIANRLEYPVIIHNREATSDLRELLASRRPVRRSIMHCFSGGWEEAKSFLDMNFVISFAGNTTYSKLEATREAARRVPADSFLIETDSPFLAPKPFRGRNNHPGTLGILCDLLAQLRGVAPKEIARTTRDTFERIVTPPVKDGIT